MEERLVDEGGVDMQLAAAEGSDDWDNLSSLALREEKIQMLNSSPRSHDSKPPLDRFL